MSTRKKYSKEFKLDAISLVLEQELSKAEAARSLEINPNLIVRWIKEHQSDESGHDRLISEKYSLYYKIQLMTDVIF